MAVKPEHGVWWRRLARLHKEALHSREWKLAAIKSEIKRIKECAGLPQHVVEEAEELAKRNFNALKGFPPEVAAVAVLWTAAKAAGAPRPLGDFLKCSKADVQKVKKAAWRLSGVVRLKRPSVEYYVKVVAARANLPAPTVKKALEILRRTKGLWQAKTRGFPRRRLFGWLRLEASAS
jgi:transcription initiation factor TFIIIB Brf1 subunit/transcription initiation factor TFIIB